jgi:hypothetical protein
MMVAPSKMYDKSAAMHHGCIIGLRDGINEKSLFVNRFLCVAQFF